MEKFDPVTGEIKNSPGEVDYKSTRLTDTGREIMDSTPIAPPIGYKRQPSLAEQIRNMVRSERLALEAEQAGYETFEEADDFDIGDDYDPTSPYEEVFEATDAAELKRRRFEEERPNTPSTAVPGGSTPPSGDPPSEGPEGPTS